MKKILIIPARRHILESYTEYLIRYLSDEFYFEMGYPPEPPYYNIKERIHNLQVTPLAKNPDDFDLIYPHFTTHFFLEPTAKYLHKIALVLLEPGSWNKDVAIVGGTSPLIEKGFGDNPYHSLRFGVDTEMFAPYPMVRTDDLLHVGFIGNIQTPRRYMKELFIDALRGLEGIRLMIYPTSWPSHTRPDEVERMGGMEMLDSIVDGDKWVTGLPNLYNQMDVFIRCDIDAGCQFSIFEAASCGVPVITCDPGLGKDFCKSGGGMYVDNGTTGFQPENLTRIAKGIREAVTYLRDHPLERKGMGMLGRDFVEKNWTWDKFTSSWRNFFREGLNAAIL